MIVHSTNAVADHFKRYRFPKARSEILTVSSPLALETSRHLARLEGVPIGASCDAALAAAINLREENAGRNIVVIIPSFAERYLPTALFEGIRG